MGIDECRYRYRRTKVYTMKTKEILTIMAATFSVAIGLNFDEFIATGAYKTGWVYVTLAAPFVLVSIVGFGYERINPSST
jgi:uncharacterized ion transporter superfamily protein YfcC